MSTTAPIPMQCEYCGCWHTGTCSRVKAIEYYPDGAKKRVELFPPLDPMYVHQAPWKLGQAEPAENHPCKVCGAMPNENGIREHGKGCYTQSAEGGGTDYVEECDQSCFVPQELPCGKNSAMSSVGSSSPASAG